MQLTAFPGETVRGPGTGNAVEEGKQTTTMRREGCLKARKTKRRKVRFFLIKKQNSASSLKRAFFIPVGKLCKSFADRYEDPKGQGKSRFQGQAEYLKVLGLTASLAL